MRVLQEKKQILWEIIALIIVLLVIVLLGWIFSSNLALIQDREALRTFVDQYPTLAPLLIILVIIIEVLVAPLPGAFIPIASGFLFGPFLGGVYAWIGEVIGSSIAFLISRHFGKPLVNRLVSEKTQGHYHSMVSNNLHGLFWLYAIPIFPIDVVSLLVGLSDISYKRFLVVSATGFIFYVVFLTYFGEILFSAPLHLVGIALTAVLFGAVVWHLYKKRKKRKTGIS